MSLFSPKNAADKLSGKPRLPHKLIPGNARNEHSAWMQRRDEAIESKLERLRHRVANVEKRAEELEKRADGQEQWNSEEEVWVRDAVKDLQRSQQSQSESRCPACGGTLPATRELWVIEQCMQAGVNPWLCAACLPRALTKAMQGDTE